MIDASTLCRRRLIGAALQLQIPYQLIAYGHSLLNSLIGVRISTPKKPSRLPMLKRRPWTRTDVKTLRTLAGRKTVKAIGRTLRRTEAAIRFKAHTQRIKLAMR
jgi:hypothetical protein